MNVFSLLAATVDSIAARYKKRDIPQLHNDNYRKILEYLPIVDKIHLSLICKRVYAITELHLRYHAVELGYLSSSTIPDITEARDFIATLFKVVRILRTYGILKKSEIKLYDHGGFWVKDIVMDTESTLRNIPKRHTWTIIGIYQRLVTLMDRYGKGGFPCLENNSYLYLFLLKHLPKEQAEINHDHYQSIVDKELRRVLQTRNINIYVAQFLLKLGANPNTSI